jgi:hypothetical protein
MFHVDCLGVLFIAWGLLTTIIGLSTLALGVGAAALIASSDRPASFAAGFTAAAFTSLAIIAILWGLAHVAVGLPLRRRRHWSRLGAMVLGSIDLILCRTARRSVFTRSGCSSDKTRKDCLRRRRLKAFGCGLQARSGDARSLLTKSEACSPKPEA